MVPGVRIATRNSLLSPFELSTDNRFANDFSFKLHPTKERRTNGDLAKSRGTGQKKCLASDNLQSSF